MKKKPEIQDIYPLSPMQEGMLFHTILNPEQSAYFEQLTIHVSGKIVPEIFQDSFAALIERYDILRTSIIYQKLDRPRQVVLKEREGQVSFIDLTLYSVEEQNDIIAEFKITERAKGFDLTKDTLLKIAVFARGGEKYTLIWSFHHILMDGWCMGIVINDFLHIYKAKLNHHPLTLEKPYPYSSFIKWLEKQNRETARTYWQNYLEDYAKTATLPKFKKRSASGYLQQIHSCKVPRHLTEELKKLAKDYEVTLNSFIQKIWRKCLPSISMSLAS